MKREKILANHLPAKGVTIKIRKGLIQLNSKKAPNDSINKQAE